MLHIPTLLLKANEHRLLQSFENDPVSQADFFKYVRLFVAQEKMTSGSLIGPVRINGIDLSFAWLDCEKSNLVID